MSRVGEWQILDWLPPGSAWCEIKLGRDFFAHDAHYDWIITNPPWSRIRAFLIHSFAHADTVIFS